MVENRIPFEVDAKRKKNQVMLNLNQETVGEMTVSHMRLSEIVGEEEITGRLFEADCISTCAWLASQNIKVDLVYIDPPFGSGGDYTSNVYLRGKPAKDDSFEVLRYTDKRKDERYLVWMAEQLRAIRTVMSEQASIYVHLDWHISHYVKILMDEIFGADNFINEIIWSYKSGGASKGSFARKHDTIYLYAKNKGKHIFNPQQEKSYNREYKPYRFKGVKEYEDGKGWYTLVNMRDVWEIDMVGRTSKERVDYATQKPIAMLERMIKASSNPDALVADFFGGSGVCAAAAEKLGRKFIHADLNPDSIFTARDRLIKRKCSFEILKNNIDIAQSEIEIETEIEKNKENWSVFVTNGPMSINRSN